MPDIFHHFQTDVSVYQVFEAVTTPKGIDAWWTKRCSGTPVEGTEYELYFGAEYDWRAVVTKCVPNAELELRMTKADKDWEGTRAGFLLEGGDNLTQVGFHHVDWPEANDHFHVERSFSRFELLLGHVSEIAQALR